MDFVYEPMNQGSMNTPVPVCGSPFILALILAWILSLLLYHSVSSHGVTDTHHAGMLPRISLRENDGGGGGCLSVCHRYNIVCNKGWRVGCVGEGGVSNDYI